MIAYSVAAGSLARPCWRRRLVMRRGRIVEEGPTADVFARPSATHTRALIEAAPGREFGWGAEHCQEAASA